MSSQPGRLAADYVAFVKPASISDSVIRLFAR